jgi:hypothetical protein
MIEFVRPGSQFPFWDFFCCNLARDGVAGMVSGAGFSLNSLFGISFVVTEWFLRRREG